MIYIFGDNKLDTQSFELHHAGELCKLEPRVFDILLYLIEHRGQVVTRGELLDHLWPGQFISEAVLSNSIMVARKAVGDSGRAQRVIKTIHGRGYRFIAVVEERQHGGLGRAESVLPETICVAETKPWEAPNGVPPATSGTAPGPLSQDVLAGDYELATVLCVTLDNVPTLAEQLGFNTLQGLRQTFFRLAQDRTQHHRGTFQFFGTDSALLFFAPVTTLEHHSQRAVRAATELQHLFHEQAPDTSSLQSVDCTIRMGLHTGPLSLERPIEPMVGETTNLAIWLQYQAEPGTLLVSGATMQWVKDTLQAVEYGAVRIPGQSAPIVAYTVE